MVKTKNGETHILMHEESCSIVLWVSADNKQQGEWSFEDPKEAQEKYDSL